MSSIIKFLGNKKITVKPCMPFGNQEIDFLDSLSKMYEDFDEHLDVWIQLFFLTQVR